MAGFLNAAKRELGDFYKCVKAAAVPLVVLGGLGVGVSCLSNDVKAAVGTVSLALGIAGAGAAAVGATAGAIEGKGEGDGTDSGSGYDSGYE